jgi:hypothetical protein
MRERVAAVRTESRGYVRNADNGVTRRTVMLYSLLKTLLFVRCHSKASAKSDCRFRYVCWCAQSLHIENSNFTGQIVTKFNFVEYELIFFVM